jgi:hypothetical protein
MLRVRGGVERAQKFSRRKAKHLEVLAFNYSTFFIAMVTQELLSSRRFFYSLPGAGNKKKEKAPTQCTQNENELAEFLLPSRTLSGSHSFTRSAATDLFAEWRSRSESVLEQVPDNACLLLQPPISKTTTGSAAAANTCRQSGQCAAEHAFFIVPQPTQSHGLFSRALWANAV